MCATFVRCTHVSSIYIRGGPCPFPNQTAECGYKGSASIATSLLLSMVPPPVAVEVGREPSHSNTPSTPPADSPLLSRAVRHCSLFGGRLASRILVSGEVPCSKFTSTTRRAQFCAAAIFCARFSACLPTLAVGFNTLCRLVCP